MHPILHQAQSTFCDQISRYVRVRVRVALFDASPIEMHRGLKHETRLALTPK